MNWNPPVIGTQTIPGNNLDRGLIGTGVQQSPYYPYAQGPHVVARPISFCPAHGAQDVVFMADDKRYCLKCIASLFDRSGVHQMTDKAPAQVKKW